MGRKLYVGNFPYEVGETELQDLFAKAGTVESVKVMRDMATGRARGFAFVEMGSDEEAQKAISDLNEYQMGGRSLTVNEARPKPTSGGGGGGSAVAARAVTDRSRAGSDAASAEHQTCLPRRSPGSPRIPSGFDSADWTSAEHVLARASHERGPMRVLFLSAGSSQPVIVPLIHAGVPKSIDC